MPQWTKFPEKSGYHWFKALPESKHPQIVHVSVFGDMDTDFRWTQCGNNLDYYGYRHLEDGFSFYGPIEKPE